MISKAAPLNIIWLRRPITDLFDRRQLNWITKKVIKIKVSEYQRSVSVHQVVDLVLNVAHYAAFSVLFLHHELIVFELMIVGGLWLSVAFASASFTSDFVFYLCVLLQTCYWVHVCNLLWYFVRVVASLDGAFLVSIYVIRIDDSLWLMIRRSIVGHWGCHVDWHLLITILVSHLSSSSFAAVTSASASLSFGFGLEGFADTSIWVVVAWFFFSDDSIGSWLDCDLLCACNGAVIVVGVVVVFGDSWHLIQFF